MGKPYVIVIDSARFKVSPECGRALTMIRYLLDRWGEEAVFIHLEPFEYQVITEEPVLSGSLTDPPMNKYSRAFGLGDATWPGTKMPWIFVVDGQRDRAREVHGHRGQRGRGRDPDPDQGRAAAAESAG